MDTTTFYVKPGTSAERKDLYERLDAKNTAPLWEVLGKLVTPEPQSACLPALWLAARPGPVPLTAAE